MGTVGGRAEFAVVPGSAGDAGVRERGISHAVARGVFLLVPEALVREPLVVGRLLRWANRGHTLCALPLWQDDLRPGSFDGPDASVGVASVRHAEPGVSRGGAGGVAAELLETGNRDGPAALPRAGVRRARRDALLSATSDRNLADQSQPAVLPIL